MMQMFFKESQNEKLGFSSINSKHEKERFAEIIYAYAGRGGAGECIDFASMAIDWCEYVDDRVKNNTNSPAFYRKTPHQLEEYFKSNHKGNNIISTLQKIMESINGFEESNTSSAVGFNVADVTVRYTSL